MFKIGIGPSSSHTVGPMKAARDFLIKSKSKGFFKADILKGIKVELYGSLALTGIGHGTDKAVLMGLLGETPEDVDTTTIYERVDNLKFVDKIKLLNEVDVSFDYREAIQLIKNKRLPYHTNGMKFHLLGEDEKPIFSDTFYSVGGGFIIDEERVNRIQNNDNSTDNPEEDEKRQTIPYHYKNATELFNLSKQHNKPISKLVLENEKHFRTEEEIDQKLDKIVKVMMRCIDIGLKTEGILPGRLKISRRAPILYKSLLSMDRHDPSYILNVVNSYALAASEENASGGQVVTAPTNGASGIIPAVYKYYLDFHSKLHPNKKQDFILTAAAIGSLYKINATISGAEGGCQAEIGVSSSMAAAGLTAALGGTVEQIECAAEGAMEQFIGLTCDPVGGLVQVPCIERNAIAAQKAINATIMALRNSHKRMISLDNIILEMKRTGDNMRSKYKETSKGGLAKVIDDEFKEKEKKMKSRVNTRDDEILYINETLC